MSIKVIIPEATENLITNPSFEKDTTGWSHVTMATFERSATWQARGTWSLRCVANSAGDYVITPLFNEINLVNYVGSAYVKVISGTWVIERGGGAGPTVSIPALYEGRVEVPWTADATQTNALGFRCTSASGEIYIDAAQVEQKSGYKTSYCDGDQLGCTWRGSPQGSASLRTSQVRAGGQEIDFETYFTTLDYESITGAGMPPQEHITQKLGLGDGALMQRIRSDPAILTFKGMVYAADTAAKHAQRRMLIDVIKPDRVSPLQPMTMVLDYGGAEVEIPVYYLQGLEGDLHPPGLSEELTLQFIAYDPRWKKRVDKGVVLTPYSTLANVNRIIRRNGNDWENLSTGLAGNAPANKQGAKSVLPVIIDRRNRDIYAAGGFLQTGDGSVTGLGGIARYNHATGVWSALGTGLAYTGASQFGAYSALFGPNGDLYVGGDFESAGGVANSRAIAKWNGSAWESVTPSAAMTSATTVPFVDDMALSGDGILYAGGKMITVDGVSAINIAKYDTYGKAWARLHATDDPDSTIFTVHLMPDNDTLYIGGFFNGFGAVASNGIIRYNRKTGVYTAMVAGVNQGVFDGDAMLDGSFIFVGTFTQEDLVAAFLTRIAIWNGTGFVPLSTGVGDPNKIREVAFVVKVNNLDGVAYVGGIFGEAGGRFADGIVRWNGSVWTDVPIDLPGQPSVFAIDTYNDDLVLGFETSGTAIIPGKTVITNAGTSDAYPVIVITGPGNLRSILNYTTGDEITFPNLSILANETVTIDLRPGIKTIISNQRGSLIQHLDPGSALSKLRLAPGDNSIYVFVTEAQAVFTGDSQTNATSSATSLTITRPKGVKTGDEMLAHIHTEGTVTISAAPSGWTLVRSTSFDGTATNVRLSTYRKTAVLADETAANYQWTFSGTTEAVGSITNYKGVHATPIHTDAGKTMAGGPGTRFEWGEITTTIRNTLIVYAVAANHEASGVTSPTWSIWEPLVERVDRNNASGLSLAVGDLFLGAPGQISPFYSEDYANASGNYDKGVGHTIALAPASSTQPTVHMYWRERYWSIDV